MVGTLIKRGADPNQVPKAVMILSQALQFVVIEIATESHDRQHQNLPIIESWSSDIASGIWVKVRSNQATEFGS